MRAQQGFSMADGLIGLFLASILMVIVSQWYLSTKYQYKSLRKQLDRRLDLQWISELLANSIRRAGFTPCLSIDKLHAIDRRNEAALISSLKIDNIGQEALQINRMSEEFAQIIDIPQANKLLLSKTLRPNPKRPILIADCYHAEVHRIHRIISLDKGFLIMLTKNLRFSYPSITYVGEWLEEKWFIKKNPQGRKALYYQLTQAEELSALIHSLKISQKIVAAKHCLTVDFGLDEAKTQTFMHVVRGS